MGVGMSVRAGDGAPQRATDGSPASRFSRFFRKGVAYCFLGVGRVHFFGVVGRVHFFGVVGRVRQKALLVFFFRRRWHNKKSVGHVPQHFQSIFPHSTSAKKEGHATQKKKGLTPDTLLCPAQPCKTDAA